MCTSLSMSTLLKLYPDWSNEVQICSNDGNSPEYMREIKELNYLYRSKEECCQVRS